MKLNYYTINAFAKNEIGGNPAGIVFDAENLSNQEMQNIAKYIGFSETAFVSNSQEADFEVAFFTPNAEVDLCGHATIGLFNALFLLKRIKPGNYTLKTKAGILKIKIEKNGCIMMDQQKPTFYEVIDPKEVIESLGIELKDLNTDYPCQIVSTGLKDILLPIRNKEILNSIKPDFEKIKEISKTHNIVGFHLFALDDNDEAITANCRNFAPLYEIDEESATGTSNGALACYLWKYKIIKNSNNMIFEQGEAMNKPSLISVDLDLSNNQIDEVQVGGTASNLQSLEVQL